MPKVLHFADAHIDIANHGRRNPETGLPLRVHDFLIALDTIVDAAIDEKVDLVIFSGDAYKDRSPVPTFQREWGRRMMRLSQASIPTLLLVGNHDLSPSQGRAHALQEYETLQIPHVQAASKPALFKPEDLGDVPLQVIVLPWMSRSGIIASLGMSGVSLNEIYDQIQDRLIKLIDGFLDEVDKEIPVILAAHASVQGAKYGGERSVLLGSDLVLSGSLVCDPRLDYVALGHIHKAQDVNERNHPPVIYPGSIERVDFGEAGDEKFYVLAEVSKGATAVVWRKLDGRRFVDFRLDLSSSEDFLDQINAVLPPPGDVKDAIVRMTITYDRDWETKIDETAIQNYMDDHGAFEFHLVRRPQMEARIRLPQNQTISSLSVLEVLDIYWKTTNLGDDEEQVARLQKLAAEIIADEGGAS